MTVKRSVLLASLGFGVAAALAALARPRGLIAVLRPDPDVVYFAPDEPAAVALTLDDGPSSGTEAILEVLEAHGVHATFFLITVNASGHEAEVSRIVAAGHEIANHMTTDYPSVLLAPPEFRRELERADAAIRRVTHPRWFRPANGIYSRRMLDTVREFGYQCVLGDIWPIDTIIRSPKVVAWYTLRVARPGSIVILHDLPNRLTADTVRALIDGLKSRGIAAVSVGELLNGATATPRGRATPSS